MGDKGGKKDKAKSKKQKDKKQKDKSREETGEAEAEDALANVRATLNSGKALQQRHRTVG